MRSSCRIPTRPSRCRARSHRLAPAVAVLAALLTGVCEPGGVLATQAPPSADTSRTFHAPLGGPVCVHTLLFDNTLEVTCCKEPGPDLLWRGQAQLRSVPVDRLTRFLPEPARLLRGGSISGEVTFSGFLNPGQNGNILVEMDGTLSPDSLWWSHEDELGGVREWVLSDAHLRLHITVHGSRSRPLFSGSLTGETGTIEYLGRDLSVSFCHASFLDSTVMDPVIDLSARTSIVSNAGTEYGVQFNVTGPASRAKPVLSSSPALDRQDIENLLALGTPLSAFAEEYVEGHEGSYWSQQVFLLRAVEVGANRIVGVAESRARSLLGLDEVRVPTARDMARGQSEMEIAKRVGGRATLSYSSPMWHSGAYRVRLDLRLTDHFSLESENDQTGDSGMDLRFKVRFR